MKQTPPTTRLANLPTYETNSHTLLGVFASFLIEMLRLVFLCAAVAWQAALQYMVWLINIPKLRAALDTS
jgi:hypothetical protein